MDHTVTHLGNGYWHLAAAAQAVVAGGAHLAAAADLRLWQHLEWRGGVSKWRARLADAAFLG